MGKMLVYHGSYTEIRQPEIRKGRNTKDFGNGFYCTVIKEQAQRWAKRYRSSVVNVYSALIDEDLRILEFASMTEEWLDFIVDCRSGKSHSYDIVEGPMEDDTIYNYVQGFIDGKYSRKVFWELAKFKYPTHQISFHTARSLETLKFLEGELVHGEK